jgi:hydroxyethylthiazole kinase-like uncharacterized protein yjeF
VLYSEKEHGSFGEYYPLSEGLQGDLLPAATEMAELDRQTIANGVSSIELMNRAGDAIAGRILAVYPAAKRAVVLCGSGNNGGDGLVIAKKLRQSGIATEVVLVAAKRYTAECLKQLSEIGQVRLFGETTQFGSASTAAFKSITAQELLEITRSSDLVVDSLLGTGQRDAPREFIADLVRIVRTAQILGGKFKVVAVDMPTGIDSDTGAVFRDHIEACRTVTVQYIKRGMLQFPARLACGVIESVDIGIAANSTVEYSLVSQSNLPQRFFRPADVHKGVLGRVLVIGGSLSMPGAPMLSSLGALRTGAGIVSRCIRGTWTNMVPLPEAMYEVLGGDAASFQPSDTACVVEMAGRYDVCVIGPGLGTDSGTKDFLVGLLEALSARGARVVLDADALNLISLAGINLSGLSAIVTPHPGEAGRLLGCTSADVQKDRYKSARDLAQSLKAVAVLKGAGSIIHDGSKGRLVADGTPYLATPGSGDVLSGIIATCLAQTESRDINDIREAASLGVWLHARAGVLAANDRGGPILAREIADWVGRGGGR